MTPATINNAAMWANQVSALSAQRAARALAAATAGGSASGSTAAGGNGDLFADLISSLSHGAATLTNSSTAAGTTSATGTTAAAAATPGASTAIASRAQISQDVQALSQSLAAALAANRAATPQSSAAAGTAVSGTAASGSTPPLGHSHGHGHGGGKHESIQSLIDELNASSTAAAGTSGTATSSAVASVNSAFSKLMTDLGVAGANSTGSNTGAASAVSTQGSSPPLRGLLQTLLQHVQQQGSFGAASGNLVHAVA
jgi:hypothetical protein